MNWMKTSQENGGPLSIVRPLGLPYCEKSCVNFHMTVSAVFVVILNANGYLLNVSAMSRYSFPLKLKKSAARSCQGTSGTSPGIIGGMCWVALCYVQVLHLLTYSTMSMSIPGQYNVALVLCCIFSIPKCISCNSCSDLS